MEWRASPVVSIIDIHIFDGDKVIKWARLIALGRHMEHVRSVNVLQVEVCIHLIDHEFDKLDIAVICAKV